MNTTTTLLLIACLAVAVSASCNVSANSADQFNGDCPASSPFCTRTTPFGVVPVVFACVNCRTNCDCGMSEYCSHDPNLGYGTCQTFVPACDDAGCECRQLTPAAILDDAYDIKWKCAALVDTPAGKVIDYLGACVNGKCSITSSFDFNSSSTTPSSQGCNPEDGIETPRRPTPSGNFVATDGLNWAPSVYYSSPDLVWLAIFFVMIVISMTLQIVNTVLQVKKS